MSRFRRNSDEGEGEAIDPLLAPRVLALLEQQRETVAEMQALYKSAVDTKRAQKKVLAEIRSLLNEVRAPLKRAEKEWARLATRFDGANEELNELNAEAQDFELDGESIDLLVIMEATPTEIFYDCLSASEDESLFDAAVEDFFTCIYDALESDEPDLDDVIKAIDSDLVQIDRWVDP